MVLKKGQMHTEESWGQTGCADCNGCHGPPQPLSAFVLYRTVGGLEVSVPQQPQVLNCQEEETAVASFCTHMDQEVLTFPALAKWEGVADLPWV